MREDVIHTQVSTCYSAYRSHWYQDLLDSNRPGITHKHSVSAKEERPIVSGY